VCEDDGLLACFWGRAFYRSPCREPAEACVDPDGDAAFCALDDEPSPLCDGSDDQFVCSADARTVVHCTHGFEIRHEVCGEGTYCHESSLSAACMIGEQVRPSPVCAEMDVYTTCDGDEHVACSYGYEQSRLRCADGQTCERVDASSAQCAGPP
jgi:hypothetical protein